MSLPEVLLWQELRRRPQGLKFRRQQAANDYLTDFYCHAAKLVIQVDGEAHQRGNAPEWDSRRDLNLERHGVRILRIAARDVLDNLDGTMRLILLEASRVLTPPPSADFARRWFPSPRGEDR